MYEDAHACRSQRLMPDILNYIPPPTSIYEPRPCPARLPGQQATGRLLSASLALGSQGVSWLSGAELEIKFQSSYLNGKDFSPTAICPALGFTYF